MHKFAEFYKPHLAEILERYRKDIHLTKNKFAEKLAISSRTYYDIKYQRSMVSSVELILVLKLLSDEEKLKVLHELEELTETEDFRAYLYKIDFI